MFTHKILHGQTTIEPKKLNYSYAQVFTPLSTSVLSTVCKENKSTKLNIFETRHRHVANVFKRIIKHVQNRISILADQNLSVSAILT